MFCKKPKCYGCPPSVALTLFGWPSAGLRFPLALVKCHRPFPTMPEIFPFRALRYDPHQVKLGDVVTQPYDKITEAMQARYYELSPHNLVRIILGRRQDTDSSTFNVYTRAAEYLHDW